MELFLISEISDKDSEDCENDEVSNERPSTKLFVVFVVAWSSIAIIFSLIWWFKYRQKATALHRIFYMLPLIKLFYLVITMFYWEMKSVSDRVPLWVTVFYLISLQTSELFLFGFFLLISKGWHITRLNLTSAEKKSILGTIHQKLSSPPPKENFICLLLDLCMWTSYIRLFECDNSLF